jgi:ABC-type glycerol-3-phosphate transport system permease component
MWDTRLQIGASDGPMGYAGNCRIHLFALERNGRFNMLNQQRVRSQIPNYIVLLLLALFALTPIVILFFNSVKTTVEIGRNPIGFPEELRLDNFGDAWQRGGATPSPFVIA